MVDRVTDLNGNLIKLIDNGDGTFSIKTNTEITGSNMELYGATINDRPAANTVPVGATFMVVGTTDAWQSDGTDWVVM